MELGGQIRKYRKALSLSQDALAEKVFVSRQTVSSWENDKSYPDVNSLVLLSEVFQTSIDNLIKGDVERMKKEIDTQELTRFQRDSGVFAIFFIALLILPVPLSIFLKWVGLALYLVGLALYLVVFGIAMYFAIRIEKYKKKYDIQTYKEIVAFTEGKSLDEIEKAREEGKRPYQKWLKVVICILLGAIIGSIIIAIANG